MATNEDYIAAWGALDAAPHSYAPALVSMCSRSPRKVERVLRCNRWLYYVTGVGVGLTAAGTLFGWSNMSVVLRLEGFFGELCPGGTGTSGCAAQTVALNGVFQVGAICSFVAPVLAGMFNDRAGPRAAFQVTLLIFCLGIIVILIADATKASQALYVAFACFGSAATSMLIPFYSVANVFPKSEGFALAILNGSFDAASVVYLIMYYLHSAGVSFRTIWIAYLCGPIALLILAALLLWRPVPFLQSVTRKRLEDSVGNSPVSTPSVGASPKADDAAAIVSAPSSLASARAPAANGVAHPSDAQIDTVRSDVHAAEPSALALPPAAPPAPPLPIGRWADRPAALASRSFIGQLLTRKWLAFTPFFAVCMLRYNVYLSSVDAQLTSLGQTGSSYTVIVGIVLPLGIFVQLIVGPVLDRAGLPVAFIILWGLGVLTCILSLIPVLQLQVVTAVAFVAYRAFLFSVMTTYISRMFGYKNMGSLIGSVIICGGSFSMLATPLLVWALSARTSGDFTGPNALVLALMLAMGAFPLWFWYHSALIAAHTAAKRGGQRAALRIFVRNKRTVAPALVDEQADFSKTGPPPSGAQRYGVQDGAPDPPAEVV